MLFDNTGLLGGVRMPLFQTEGGGSGSGGSTAGAGGGSTSVGSGQTTGGQSQGQQTVTGGQTQGGGASSTSTPDVLDWDDNRQFRIKGQDKPISAKDYVRGFQSQFTKASQELARIKKEHAQTQQELQRIRQAAGGGQGQQGGNVNDQGAAMLSEIESAPFIDGKTMSGVIKDFQAGIRERDMVQLATLNKLKQIEGILNELHGTNLNSQHEQKLKRWLSEGGYPDDQDTYELADIIYRGYEGDNLDDEFPQIFEQRWKQMQGAIQRRAARERERQSKLPWVPQKGGA